MIEYPTPVEATTPESNDGNPPPPPSPRVDIEENRDVLEEFDSVSASVRPVDVDFGTIRLSGSLDRCLKARQRVTGQSLGAVVRELLENKIDWRFVRSGEYDFDADFNFVRQEEWPRQRWEDLDPAKETSTASS